jgi:hypothetical protein
VAKVRVLAKRKRSRRKLLLMEKLNNLMQHYKFPGKGIAIGSIEPDKINA